MPESSSTSSFPTAQASAKASSARRYNAAFKQDAVNLIAQEGYSFAAAARATGVSEKSLREWHKKLSPPPSAVCSDDAGVDELKKEVRRLREQLRQAEMEREILGLFPGERRPTSRVKSHEIPLDQNASAGVSHHYDVPGAACLDFGLLQCPESNAEQAGSTP